MAKTLPQNKTRLYLEGIRAKLEKGWSAKTRDPNWPKSSSRSAGQCAVTAVLLKELWGGTLVWTDIGGEEHWFNEIIINDRKCEIDLTGDQFGYPSIQIGKKNGLYGVATFSVTKSMVSEELLARVEILKKESSLRKG